MHACVYARMYVHMYVYACMYVRGSLVVVDTAGGEQSCSYCTIAPPARDETY